MNLNQITLHVDPGVQQLDGQQKILDLLRRQKWQAPTASSSFTLAMSEDSVDAIDRFLDKPDVAVPSWCCCSSTHSCSCTDSLQVLVVSQLYTCTDSTARPLLHSPTVTSWVTPNYMVLLPTTHNKQHCVYLWCPIFASLAHRISLGPCPATSTRRQPSSSFLQIHHHQESVKYHLKCPHRQGLSFPHLFEPS